MSSTLCWGVGSVFAFLALASAGEPQQRRPMIPNDLFRLEVLETRSYPSPIAFSPDGRSVVYVVLRAKAAAARFNSYLLDQDRADVWLASGAWTHPLSITNGAIDGSGFWAPTWSPDGQRLAILSNRGGNVKLWVWEKSSGHLQMASARGVDALYSSDLQWTSDHELVLPLLPEGEKPLPLAFGAQTAEAIAHEWTKARNNQGTTASVLESGVPASSGERRQVQMTLIDVKNGTERVISDGVAFATARVSPDHRHIAFLKQVGVWRPNPNNYPVKQLNEAIYQVAVTDLETLQTRLMTGTRDVFWGSLLWSPDSAQLAVVGYDGSSAEDREQVFRCEVTAAICRNTMTRALDLGLYSLNSVFGGSPFGWCGQGDLVIRGFAREGQGQNKSASSPWWIMNGSGQLQLFTAAKNASDIPSQVLCEADRQTLIGLIDGRIWRIGKDGVPLENLVPGFAAKITSIEWPRSPGEQVEGLVFGVRSSSRNELFELNLKSGRVIRLAKPSSDAVLVAYHNKSGTAAFAANNRSGTYLWARASGRENFTTVLETNKFLREIYEAELRVVEYRGEDGQDLKAWAILPFGYQNGKRYPVVAYVYPGSTFGGVSPESECNLCYLNDPISLNLQLLSAHGYVVLLPSMPLKPYGEVDDPYMEMRKGVLPAIDKLIDLGIADPGRLGVMGQSGGGYATYALITQTTRFKAAVALAGVSNLLSLYGTFDPRQRYRPYAHEDTFRMWDGETDHMGVPPWKDLDRYQRNSPINYVERVQTPLMIAQGDFDYIPMQQGEEFFTSLYRQDKRATFVRYWGEDHVLESPANVRDLWQRLYAWFEQFLRAENADTRQVTAESR